MLLIKYASLVSIVHTAELMVTYYFNFKIIKNLIMCILIKGVALGHGVYFAVNPATSDGFARPTGNVKRMFRARKVNT